MGTNAHGLLFYGFPLGTEDEVDIDYYELSEAWKDTKKPARPKCINDDYSTPEWDQWRKDLRAWEASIENCEIWFSGSESYRAYYVHCDPLKKQVEWSEQMEIDPSRIAPNRLADEQIRKFCEFSGIEYKQPKWYLATFYW